MVTAYIAIQQWLTAKSGNEMIPGINTQNDVFLR
jgi:hypothetical protein